MTYDPSGPSPTVLLSYDVSGRDRSAAVRVCHLVFGRGTPAAHTPLPYVLRSGVVWVGQSVLLLPAPLAEELAARLRALGACVSTASMHIEPADLCVFRSSRSTKADRVGTPPEGSWRPKSIHGP